MFVEHSSTNTKRSGSIEEITITRKAALRNSSRSLAPSVLFFGQSPSSGPCARGSIRSPRPRPPSPGTPASRKAWRTDAPPCVSPGASWPSCRVWVFCPEPYLRGERAPLTHRLGVALDRREAYPESAGSLALVHAPLLHGFDYLPSQIFRIGIHNPMMVRSPSSLQPALGGSATAELQPGAHYQDPYRRDRRWSTGLTTARARGLRRARNASRG